MMLLGLLVLALSDIVSATTCHEYYTSSSIKSEAARTWCNEGAYFTFSSKINSGKSVQIFYRCSGNRSNPALMLGHGWPTSSFDFHKLAALLDASFYVCALDYPGFGFSDKPRVPYRYSIFEHADVIHDFVTRINPLKSFAYLTHDEGDSVGLQVLRIYEATRHPKAYTITHHFLLNGNVYLPLAHLTPFQKALLSNTTGPGMQRLIPGNVLAEGLARKMCSPPASFSEAEELATVFNYQRGTHVLHQTIQYLQERHEYENTWLAALSNSSIPATLIWGQKDPVAIPAVGDYVWKQYLMNRETAAAAYYKIESANHYIQIDHAGLIAEIVRNSTEKIDDVFLV